MPRRGKEIHNLDYPRFFTRGPVWAEPDHSGRGSQEPGVAEAISVQCLQRRDFFGSRSPVRAARVFERGIGVDWNRRQRRHARPRRRNPAAKVVEIETHRGTVTFDTNHRREHDSAARGRRSSGIPSEAQRPGRPTVTRVTNGDEFFDARRWRIIGFRWRRFRRRRASPCPRGDPDAHPLAARRSAEFRWSTTRRDDRTMTRA